MESLIILMAMEKIVRDFKLEDVAYAANMIKESMHFDTYIKDEERMNAFCFFYVYSNLMESTEAHTYEIDGVCRGFIFANHFGDKPMFDENTLKDLMKSHEEKFKSVDEMPYVKKYHAHLEALEKYITEPQKGQITLFGVEKSFQRQGIGTELLRHLSSKHNHERYMVMTDSDCNFAFYEKNHFELVVQGDVELETEVMTKTLTTYVYSRTLFYKNEKHEEDYLVRANANEEIIAWAITSKNLVEHARQIHNLSPICTAALGRSMSAALMMGNNLKNEQDVLTLQFNGNGPMRGLVVSANNKGEVKGYTKETDIILPPNAAQHLNVGGAIGEGTLTVIRDYGLKDPYVSTTQLQTGEIAEDLTYYFASSEQTPSVVALGVLMNKDVTVRRAGGIIVQLMPYCPEASIARLERNLRKLYALTDLLEEGMTPEDMLQFILEGFDVNITEKKPVKFQCNCGRERSEQVLISIGKKELTKLRDEDHEITLNCQFCGSAYHFDEKDIDELINQID